MQAHKQQQQQQQQQQQHRHHRRQSEFIQAAAAATAPSAQSSTAAEPAAPSPLGHMNTCTASWISDTPILKWFVATLKRLVFKPCHTRPGHHVKWFAWCKCEATRCDVKNDALIWYLPNHDITRVHHAMSRTITVTDTAAPQQLHLCSTDSVSVQKKYFCHFCSTNVTSAQQMLFLPHAATSVQQAVTSVRFAAAAWSVVDFLVIAPDVQSGAQATRHAPAKKTTEVNSNNIIIL